jgi:hypothetical protein
MHSFTLPLVKPYHSSFYLPLRLDERLDDSQASRQTARRNASWNKTTDEVKRSLPEGAGCQGERPVGKPRLRQ